jgi:hypothetical protein
MAAAGTVARRRSRRRVLDVGRTVTFTINNRVIAV